MIDPAPISGDEFLEGALAAPAPESARAIADALARKYPGAAIFLYGSGISVSAGENPADILYDFYVIAPDYREIKNPLERLAARALPPNVYYFELDTPRSKLRAKYALLSVEAFERLAGPTAFHSYFWARFAQPSRLVICPPSLRPRMINTVRRAVETFLRNSQGLAADPADWREVWLCGLRASYRAELRAESPGRAETLIGNYGDWPRRTASFAPAPAPAARNGAGLQWRLRALMGGVLSAARLLKATATFDGGIDYIAWKVKRHAGVDVGVKEWERRLPFIAAPIVALRYYRLRAAARARNAGVRE